MREAVLGVQYANALWEKPLISNEEVAAALGIGLSTWQTMKKNGAAPPSLLIAGRIFYRTADLLNWIDTLAAKKNPGNAGAVEEEERV